MMLLRIIVFISVPQMKPTVSRKSALKLAPEAKTSHSAFKHCDAGNGGYKQQSPDTENLRRDAVGILKDGQQQQNQGKAYPAYYYFFVLCFNRHIVTYCSF